MNGECIPRLTALGISYEHACALRRIAMTLHRWHELECGDGNDYASWTITRGRKERRDGQHAGGHGPHWVFVHDEDGAPYEERHVYGHQTKVYYSRIPDRERGAQKRLAAIMKNYPTLAAYVQGDPRGASLYVGSKDEMTDSGYSRGVAVYK